MTVDAYLYIIYGEMFNLPYKECIRSLDWCKQVVVGVDPRFDDNTIEELDNLLEECPNLNIYINEFDFNCVNPHGTIKKELRDQCDADWCLEVDADEIICVDSDKLFNVLESVHTRNILLGMNIFNFFNGDWIHQDMPILRDNLSRNIKSLDHQANILKVKDRMGSVLIKESGKMCKSSYIFPDDIVQVLHYGWYSLPRKWEMKQILHYYVGCIDGIYNTLADYIEDLDKNPVDFWEIPEILPIQHYVPAISSEMASQPLEKFNGKHPPIMQSWMQKQRIIRDTLSNSNIYSKAKNRLSNIFKRV